MCIRTTASRPLALLVFGFVLLVASCEVAVTAEALVGAARVDVTPELPIRLTGYASRKTPSAGVEQKLWAKALAIGSDSEGPALLMTLDNCGIAEGTYKELVQRLVKKTHLKQQRIAICLSHTHTGPCTTGWAPNIFAQDIPPEHQTVIDRYTRVLLDKLEQVALAALKDRRPGRLSWSQGSVGFARNRRVIRGPVAQFGDNAAGPVDHALPVLKVEDADGKLRALVANYACHCTTLGGEFNRICGDWAGFAQEALERDHPGAVALITIGCGADANPFPRGGADGGLALAKQHGEEIAGEVERLLAQNFTPLTTRLTTHLKHIELPFAPHFTRAQWEESAQKSGIVGYHARKYLARLDRGEKLPDALSYYVQTWTFGNDLALVFLSGEVVVDYSLRLKSEFDASRLWVSGYANYVPCYIPSRRILSEGGYEAEDSLWYYDRPARISTNAEELIIKTVHDLLPKSFLFDKKKAESPDPKTPEQALATFRTRADFTVELVVSEPLIESPVAIDWDSQGRLWVCEMYDYPTGIEPLADVGRKYSENPPTAHGGYKPGGRIKVLESTRHDGHYDKATLFLDGLPFPTGVMPWRKGALICAAPDILYAEDTNGDGRADLIRTNFTGFATHNYQARVNGFTWGLDGWLHGSSGLFGGKIKCLLTGKKVDLSGRDFRFKSDTGEIEPVAGLSQMGRVRDDFDNWFGNDNSTLLWYYPLPDHYVRRNPYVTYPEPRVHVAKDTDPNKLFPISRTLERFNDPQAANRVTSACGPEIYRDDLLGTNYYGNAFICEPVHNLIRRLVLEPEGVTFAGHRAPDEQRTEFLASTDNWFRPVQVRTGPDGTLWIVDMYRFVIEHPRWIPPERLKQLDVRAGADMGRVYRVYPRGAKLRTVRDLTKLTKSQLADALNTANGPTRDSAHIELLQRKADVPPAPASSPSRDTEAASRTETDQTLILLSRLATNDSTAAVRAQALAVLENLGATSPSLLSAVLADTHPGVRRLAVRAAEPFLRQNAVRLPTDDPDQTVRLQLAFSFGKWNDARAAEALAALARNGDARLRAAVLSSATLHVGVLLQTLLTHGDPAKLGDLIPKLIATAVGAGDVPNLSAALRAIAPASDVMTDAEAGAKLESWRLEAVASLLEASRRAGKKFRSDDPRFDADTRSAALRIESVLERARKLALEPGADESVRESAIRLLAQWDIGPTVAILGDGVLGTSALARLQRAAVEALARSQAEDAPDAMLRNLRHLSPMLRSRVVEALLNREAWQARLLEAVEEGKVAASEVPVAARQRLAKSANAAVRERSEKVFATRSSAGRSEVLAKYRDVAELTGYAENGAAVFDKNCAQCHSCRGHGHAVGPNLAEFTGKSVADFLVAIFDPNMAVNPNFLAYNVETKDGRSLSGIVRGETASGFTLVQGGGTEEKILRSDIGEIRASPLSLMPEGLEQAMMPQDVADLVAWLKKSAPAPFGSATTEQAAKARVQFLSGAANGLTKMAFASERLDYPSWLGRLPLLHCRQTDGRSKLVWQAAPAAGNAASGGTCAFRLAAAMGFLSQPAGKFTLKLNDKLVLDFDVTLSDQTWQSTDGNVRVNYTVMESNAEDSNGILQIEVASDLLGSRKPVSFEVAGSASNSQRWFGVYLVNND